MQRELFEMIWCEFVVETYVYNRGNSGSNNLCPMSTSIWGLYHLYSLHDSSFSKIRFRNWKKLFSLQLQPIVCISIIPWFIHKSLLLNLVEIDSSIPTLKCELLPESTSEETIFISINPFSGLYKVISYMGKSTPILFSCYTPYILSYSETRYSQQIEYALNRDQDNLINVINLLK